LFASAGRFFHSTQKYFSHQTTTNTQQLFTDTKTDKDSLTTWNPHVIYVEGGNTFWLQHCIDKGNYSKLIKDACTGNDGAVYCGKSAGAIVAGSNVSTATWKGWDEPSVVPGRETYNQWMDCKGFGFAGDDSIFPHMNDDWNMLVEEKRNAMTPEETVHCLREEDVCCIIGERERRFVVSGPAP
jgi:peptidase E